MTYKYLVYYKKNNYYYFATIVSKDEDEAIELFEKNNAGAYVIEVGLLEKPKKRSGRVACLNAHSQNSQNYKKGGK